MNAIVWSTCTPCLSTEVSTEYYNYFNTQNMKMIVFEVLICALWNWSAGINAHTDMRTDIQNWYNCINWNAFREHLLKALNNWPSQPLLIRFVWGFLLFSKIARATFDPVLGVTSKSGWEICKLKCRWLLSALIPREGDCSQSSALSCHPTAESMPGLSHSSHAKKQNQQLIKRSWASSSFS